MSGLAQIMGLDVEDPTQALALELAEGDRALLRGLVRLRRKAGLTQEDVAKRLGVSQPTVQNFERVGNDPRLSTIRRYALAIGARVDHDVSADDRVERAMIRKRDPEPAGVTPQHAFRAAMVAQHGA